MIEAQLYLRETLNLDLAPPFKQEKLSKKVQFQWQIQDLPEGRVNLLFAILFCRKLHENEKMD